MQYLKLSLVYHGFYFLHCVNCSTVKWGVGNINFSYGSLFAISW